MPIRFCALLLSLLLPVITMAQTSTELTPGDEQPLPRDDALVIVTNCRDQPMPFRMAVSDDVTESQVKKRFPRRPASLQLQNGLLAGKFGRLETQIYLLSLE